MKKFHKAFTVLELLIVIAIMCILMALILTGLDAARTHSEDEDKVTNLQTVVVGLDEYYDACRQYPATLDATSPATCPNLGTTKSILDFIPNLATFDFNQTNSGNFYAGLTTDQGDSTDCTGYHIGTTLQGNAASFGTQKSSFNSTQLPNANGVSICTGTNGSTSGFDGTNTQIFDIEK